MAFSAGQVYEITVGGEFASEPVANIWHVRVIFASSPTITAENLGQAFWNHVKTAYRAIATTGWSTAFTGIKVEEVDVVGGMYGFYAIPPAEQAGTRVGAPAGQESPLPPFNAAGTRLNVGSKVTRPGQKRFYGLAEGDNAGGTLGAAATTAINNLGALVTTSMVLGAPALTTEIRAVVRKTAPNDVPSVNQDVLSFSIPTSVRSQVSRRQRAF